MAARSEITGSDPIVAELVRAIELSDAFQLCILVGRREDLRGVVARTLDLARELSPDGLVVRWTSSTRQLLDEHHPGAKSRTIIVFDARGPAAVDEYYSLNLSRDTLRTRGPATLLVLLLDEDEPLFASAAPDLRSVNSVYLHLPMSWPDEPAFQGWVDGCRSAFDAKVASTAGATELYALGVYSFAYELDHVQSHVSVPELRDAMRSFKGLTGWRPWWVPDNVHAPYAVSLDELECWMIGGLFNDPAHGDFWRASTTGRFYLLRGYEEDSHPDRVRPGKISSGSLAVWRVAEALLHAEQAVHRFANGSAWVHLVARWEGLRDRSWSTGPMSSWGQDGGQTALMSEVCSSLVCPGRAISQRLPELVLHLVRPLSDVFLTALAQTTVEREISALKRRPSA